MNDEEIDFYLDRLAEIEVTLASNRRQLVALTRTHAEERITAFFHADATTIREKENLADYQVLNLRDEIERLKVEIKITEDERDHLKFGLTLRTRTYARA